MTLRPHVPTAALAFALACGGGRDDSASTRWPVPEVDGALRLEVRHPRPDAPPPPGGRDYVMGSTGSGRATVRVNGTEVRVRPNGSFLAWVSLPSGLAAHVVTARLDGDSAVVAVPVHDPSTLPATAAPSEVTREPAPLRGAVVVVPAGNMMGVGQRDIPGREQPEGDYSWFVLPGTRGEVVEVRGDLRRVRFAVDAIAWIEGQFLRPAPTPPAGRGAPAPVRLVEERGLTTGIVIASPTPLAYRVVEEERRVTFTVFGAGVVPGALSGAGYVAGATTTHAGPGTVVVKAALRGPAYGYEVRWEAGAIVLRLRHPPAVDSLRPLAGLSIVVDAGHPPGGAVGPTGVAEPAVTLDVARRVERLLRERGAVPVLTRSDESPLSLDERVSIARASEAHAFVSLHADAVASGADPSHDVGTAVYAYRPHSAPLAAALQLALVARLGFADRGARVGDYAVVRSTWLPAVLCEGATMTVPEQEAALAQPAFRQAYAQGVVEGLERYFRELHGRAGGAVPVR